MLQMWNNKFEVSDIICFSVMLITDKHTDRRSHTRKPTVINVIFEFRKPQNLLIYQNVNFESLFQK